MLALGLGACAGDQVRNATFRARPDSVEPGDLRGPFRGRVVEAETGKPVAGALVYATWTFEAGYGSQQPGGFHEYVTSTDTGGHYHVPALSKMPEGRSTVVTDFHLVVYKRGFVAYRSDRRFSDLGPRHDFAQNHHTIALEAWREELSHAQHLRYVGGGPAIAALTAWEAEEAAAELTGARAPAGGMRTSLMPQQRGVYVVATQLLEPDDVKAITGYDGDFETGPLGDEADTATYTSQHLKALNRPESYDVAVRIWRLEPGEAQQRYGTLVETLPGVEETDEIADRSLRATEGSIFGVAFLDGRRGLVMLLTCGQGQCSSPGIAAQLGATIHRRIQALWPL